MGVGWGLRLDSTGHLYLQQYKLPLPSVSVHVLLSKVWFVVSHVWTNSSLLACVKSILNNYCNSCYPIILYSCFCLIPSPKVYESPATCCMTSLFISLLCDALNEYAYDAELAGISYKICGTVYSLDVRINVYVHCTFIA